MKVLIPAYEPTKKLINLVEELQNENLDIIVVNDGSKKEFDNIFKQLEEKNIKVLTHETNKGKGEAIKTGIKYLVSQNEPVGCIVADCDGQHKTKDIIKVMKRQEDKCCDLVLGVRDFKTKGIPFRSKIGNEISKMAFKMMTGIKISDTQTGLRAYSARIFPWLLEIDGSRYEFEFNMLLKLKEDNINFEEVKIETVYEDNNKQSHFNPIKDSILIYKPVVKFLASSVLAFLIDFILLLVLQKLTNNLLLSVIIARIISSAINFVLNKNYVFERKKDKNTIKMLIKYYLLAVIILVCNYLILNFLYKILGINLVISKMLTEIILYMASFIIQKRIVFK